MIPISTETRIGLRWHESLLAYTAVALATPLSRLRTPRLNRVLLLLRRGTVPAHEAGVWRARQAVVTVSSSCAGSGHLRRSLATVLFCRARGHWPDFCLGIRADPLATHTWLEVAGSAVGELVDVSAFHPNLTVRHGDSLSGEWKAARTRNGPPR